MVKIPNKIRYLNKRFTNRIMMKIAGKKHSPIVLIEHSGRKSRKVYKIPLMAAPCANGFMFALTYGKEVDWYKNVIASNRAILTYQGYRFQLSEPVTVSADKGQKAFASPKNTILRLIGIQDFFYMKASLLEEIQRD